MMASPKELLQVYMSVDDLVQLALAAGKGTEIAKIDVSQAYRNVPVHVDDRCLLGMEWQGRVFIDETLLFELRSAPVLLTALGDATQWVSLELGSTCVCHYIDDFVTIGPASTEVCESNMRHLKGTCGRLGMRQWKRGPRQC